MHPRDTWTPKLMKPASPPSRFSIPRTTHCPKYLLTILAQSISDVGANATVRVVILKSGGNRTFCAGASFDELVAVRNEADGFQFFSGFANVINACRTCDKIILGRVQGKAIGGGVGVAASTDYCFATRYASVRLSELAIGIGPFVVGPAIERKIGTPALTSLSLNPTQFRSSDWALEHGLYQELFEDAEAMDVALAQKAKELASYNPDAIREWKRSLWRGTEDWDELLAARAQTSGRLVLSDFTREALISFKS